MEIVLQIVASIPQEDGQPTRWACSLVSRDWNAASVERLYYSPVLNMSNFQKFVRLLCPPSNVYVRHRAYYSGLVRVLDMSRLSASFLTLTPRLLSRLTERLEVFVAPAALLR